MQKLDVFEQGLSYSASSISLSNIGESVFFSGAFISEGTTPGSLIIYGSEIINKHGVKLNKVLFPANSDLFIENVEFQKPDIIII